MNNKFRKTLDLAYTQRDSTIDVMKGIGIICVVLAHITTIYSLRNIIYSFHMPLFFFLSGYFFSYKSSSDLIKISSKKLIIPYFIFSFISIFIITIYKQFNLSINDLLNCLKMLFFANGYYLNTRIWGNITPIGILWFLPALFWCRLFYNNIIICKEHINTIILSIIISLASIYLGGKLINLPLGIFSGGQAVVFYMLGHKYHNNYQFIPKSITFKIIIFLIWIIIAFTTHLSMADFSYNNIFLNIIGALFGIYIIHNLSQYITSNYRYMNKLLCWFGKNSLYVLGFHSLYMLLFERHSQYNKIEWILPFIIQILAIVITIQIYKMIKNIAH